MKKKYIKYKIRKIICNLFYLFYCLEIITFLDFGQKIHHHNFQFHQFHLYFLALVF